MNEVWPFIYRKANGMLKRVKWWSLEGNCVNLQTWKVWLLFCSKLNQNLCFKVLITYGRLLNMIRSKNAQTFVFRGQIMNFKFWLEVKLQFQGTIFESMTFLAQGVLGHDSWSFIKMRSHALKWKNNGVKWML